ncbi:hypothetical protein, partial [Accumulibacter sp.]|uniref:hypothetical protein n=1 Tax=Accumulibacter sp. TaxID=2053492 RepID=UPI00261E5D36
SIRSGIGAVFGQLRAEPAMQSRYQPQVGRSKADFPAAGNTGIRDLEMRRAALEIPYSRHVGAMQLRRVRKVALLKPPGLLLEMLPNQSDLIGGAGVPGDHLLNASELGHLEDVHRLCQLEGHDLMRHLVYVFLPGFGMAAAGQGDDERRSQQVENRWQVLAHRQSSIESSRHG